MKWLDVEWQLGPLSDYVSVWTMRHREEKAAATHSIKEKR